MAGGEWSEWFSLDKKAFAGILATHPNSLNKRWPVSVSIWVYDVADPAIVDVETRFKEDGPATLFSMDLFGSGLNFLIWEDEEDKPQVGTPAQYNKRFWDYFQTLPVIPESERPKHFALSDSFRGLGSERTQYEDGIAALARIGFTVLEVPPACREILLKNGIKKVSGATYDPPNTYFAFNPVRGTQWKDDDTVRLMPQEELEKWAQEKMEPYWEAGFAPEDMAFFILCDEPGWYYPAPYSLLESSPGGMKQFREYLAAQGLKPQDVGAKAWEEVKPLGRSGAVDLPSNRLFYWTSRFFAWSSTRHFANCTAALEKASRKGLPVGTNWNNFASRLYSPGASGNNPDQKNPDTASGSHDWLEFGRLRGGTMMMTEDWFGNSWADCGLHGGSV